VLHIYRVCETIVVLCYWFVNIYVVWYMISSPLNNEYYALYVCANILMYQCVYSSTSIDIHTHISAFIRRFVYSRHVYDFILESLPTRTITIACVWYRNTIYIHN